MTHLKAVTESIGEAHNIMDTVYSMPNNCLFRNYQLIYDKLRYIVDRTYEDPFKWYFITFKPFNNTYEKNIDFYTHKGIDHCRKKLGKVDAYIFTRETDAMKTHINCLCVSNRDLSNLLHEKKTNKYFIYCKETDDRTAVLKYILKEAKHRRFEQFIDYTYHS